VKHENVTAVERINPGALRKLIAVARIKATTGSGKDLISSRRPHHLATRRKDARCPPHELINTPQGD
jgi:hypothetical protein